MPKRHSQPRRRRLAKAEALAQWRKEHRAVTQACAMVLPSGGPCRGIAVRLGYCAQCWGDAA